MKKFLHCLVICALFLEKCRSEIESQENGDNISKEEKIELKDEGKFEGSETLIILLQENVILKYFS